MGLPALLLGIWSGVKGLGRRDERPSAAAVSAGAGGAGGVIGAIGKIERLQKLKESGAINDGEFQREKAKILAEQ
jgi:hypothetical protein